MLQVKGDKELIRGLNSCPKKVGDAGLRKGTRGGAKLIQKRVKVEIARAGIKKRTGNLNRNIKVRALKRKVGRIGARCFIAPDAFYGSFLDLGYKHNSKAKLKLENRRKKSRILKRLVATANKIRRTKGSQKEGRYFMKRAALAEYQPAVRLISVEVASSMRSCFR